MALSGSGSISMQIDGARLHKDLVRVLGPIPRRVLEAQNWAEIDVVRWYQSNLVRGVAKASGIPARVFRDNAAFSRRPVPKGKQRSHPRFYTEPREVWLGTNPIMAGFLGKVKENRKRRTVTVGRRRFENARRGWSKTLGPVVLRGETGWDPVMVDVTGGEGVALSLRDEAIKRYQDQMIRRMGRILAPGLMRAL